MTTLEKEVLENIQLSKGIRRAQLRPRFAMLTLGELRIILAELLAQGKIIEIEYKLNGMIEFFYLPMVQEFRVRGKGIE